MSQYENEVKETNMRKLIALPMKIAMSTLDITKQISIRGETMKKCVECKVNDAYSFGKYLCSECYEKMLHQKLEEEK